MKRITQLLFLSIAFVFLFSFGIFASEPEGSWLDYAATEYAGGDGTADSPFCIETAEQLALLAKDCLEKETVNPRGIYRNTFFELKKDIDLGAHYWSSFPFAGCLEGNNHVIRNMKIFNTGNGHSGFFSRLNYSTGVGQGSTITISIVENLHFVDPQVSLDSSATGYFAGGVLTGEAYCSFIYNCTVENGFVDGFYYSGGLIGKLYGINQNGGTNSARCHPTIERCSSSASVRGAYALGGIVGHIDGNGRTNKLSCYISDCWSSGDLTSTGFNSTGTTVGGIVGLIDNKVYGAIISNCFSLSKIDTNCRYVGGLVGFATLKTTRGMKEFELRDSVALNPSLDTTYSNSAQILIGRVLANGADISSTGIGSCSGIWGLDTMTLQGNTVEDDEYKNGNSVTREQLSSVEFWKNYFNFDFSEDGAWVWDELAEKNGYPSLKKEVLERTCPYFVIQPKDNTVYRTLPAQFGVEVAGGTMEYTYQWQVTTDNGSTWTDLSGETSSAISIENGKLGNSSIQYVRCVVKDQTGQEAISRNAKLTITLAKYTVDDAVDDLITYYSNKGELSIAKEAFGLATAVDDMSAYNALPFWSAYTGSYSYGLGATAGNLPYALMDTYVLGIDPHNYIQTGDGQVRNVDLFANILSKQDEETGAICFKYSSFPIFEYDFPTVILALEMYFNGGTWGNEKEGTSLGRDGAIEYFFSQLKEHSSGGLVYYDIITYKQSYTVQSYIQNQRCFAEAAILAARLVGDPQWGDQAEEALSGLMKTLEYLYDTRGEVSNNSAFQYTESQARYVSALIAAGNATDNWFKKTSYFNLADEVVKNEIMPAKCIDGGYNRIAGESAVTGDAKATAAVMMALGDYENQSSILMDYVFEVPDAAAAANDLAAIVIDSPVTGDLELVATGAYGSAITWETSDKSVISASGKVTRGAEDQSVTLTATATKGEAVATRSFVLTVKAGVSNADEDALDAILNGLNVPIETTHDVTLEESSDKDVTLTWATSDADVLDTDGKVVRPAVGSADVDVTLTATATKGELSKSKEFIVKVYAETDDSLKEAYYITRDKYLNKKSIGGYWSIWAAYAALGDYITDPVNGYSLAVSLPSNEWYGTQYGASVNAIVAMGENPYNYQGKNWVKMLQDNYGGPYAGPTYSELGMEAAGADSDYGFISGPEAGISATSKEAMEAGIDIAGWATVILAAHQGEEGVAEASRAIIDHFKGMGVSEPGNLGSAGINFISNGCAVMGMAALYSVGYEDADISTWKNETSGKSPVDAVYEQGFIEKRIPGYEGQIEIALCDLYNAKYKGGTSAWVSCRVSGAKLAAQEAAANEILANAEAYEAESIEAIKTALAATAEISEERRSANIADYGEEYYALYDAVRYAALIGQAEKDAEAAAAVSETLNALKDASDIALSDKEDVEAARAAYDGMTDKQKELVDEAALAKLEAAEAAIAALDAAQGEAAQAAADKAAAKVVKNAINALPSEKDLLGSDAAAVEAARAAYDALSDAQKALVSEKTVAKLEAAEARMEALAGLDVVDIGAMTDVQESDWFYGDVAYALGNGLFKGMTATTFGPEASMTRGQFVTVLGRYAGVEDSSAAYPQQTIYSDVSANEYYAAHVKWATDNGITVGTSATTFSPEAEITRQDMSVMMLRFAKAMGIILPAAGDALFADDAAIADYAKEAVYRMKAAGIVNGMGDNKFMPQEKSRRCEVAAVLHRFFTMEDPEDAVDTVVVSVEKFTLGQGYVVEPTVMELEDGDTAESVIYRLLEEEGIEYRCKTNYLIGIRDNDTSEAVFPQYILDQVDAEGGSLEERQESGWLKEFDYSSSSGWMYWVNNREPVIDGFSPGIAQYVMQPGDVMRFQFTVIGLGKDLGADGYGEPYVRPANKDALTVAAAKCNDKTSEAYQNALKVLMNMESSQAEVDAAAAALQ